MNSLQIIGGEKRGKKIFLPDECDIRPTKNILRKALFDIINMKIISATFLDIFCGSGAIGLEAISRGAKLSVFVDENSSVISALKKNVSNCNFENRAIVLQSKWQRALERLSEDKLIFDYIFVDAPYTFSDYNTLIEVINNCHILSTTGRVFVEKSKKKKIELTGEIKIVDERKYGNSSLVEVVY